MKNSSPPPSTSITPSRANLLESIRQGTKLKKVTTRQSKPAGNDLMSSLTARLDSRRKVLSDRDRASIQKFPKKKSKIQKFEKNDLLKVIVRPTSGSNTLTAGSLYTVNILTTKNYSRFKNFPLIFFK